MAWTVDCERQDAVDDQQAREASPQDDERNVGADSRGAGKKLVRRRPPGP